MTIKAILFDLDGTLIDSNQLIIESFRHTLEQFTEKNYTDEELQTFIGPPLQDSLEKIRPDQVDEMMQTYRKHNLENHDHFVKAFDGVFETIQDLHQKGIPMAIVTTKRRNTAIRGLELTNLNQFFDVVIGLDDVTHAKPDPEPIEKGLEALGVSKEGTIMIGDNSHDIDAGKNAGTLTAGVEWSAKGADFMKSLQPDYLLKHITDLIDLVEE
ncbi:pyrophosphatase PpaX [Halalkalibacillus halophilus]|uniref:pyrophosphatase PpaX n=1 Tax=Halalkalibacillus halophilus TaxID=392827 RepID=UPI0003F8534A|nr:pyrophosphatase PpaX [Halalkalibacillus halophilus]